MIAASGDVGAIGVGFFGVDKIDNFGVGDFFALILSDALV